MEDVYGNEGAGNLRGVHAVPMGMTGFGIRDFGREHGVFSVSVAKVG